ncbi:MAG: sulfotransferase [Proteobacteria bacterium]|nr:sulfotransferase [Pseudomonadota bacterium]
MNDEATRQIEEGLPFQIHFISGLPRSGSTLLAALLRQNPRFHAGMTGPLYGLFNTLLGEMSARNEFSVFIDEAQRRRVLTALVRSFHAGHAPEKGVVFDTSRAWTSKLAALGELFPGAKLIACVRHMPWILDSIERVVQRNMFQPSIMFDYQPGGTVYSRVEGVAGANGLVGHSYNALKEAFFGANAERMMLLQYETLVAEPRRALDALYEFIGEPRVAHDFETVSYDARAYDERAGTPGLHEVRARVSATSAMRETILPPELFRRFESDSFWRNPELNPRKVRIV